MTKKYFFSPKYIIKCIEDAWSNSKFQLRLWVQIITLIEWFKSTVFLKIKCWVAHTWWGCHNIYEQIRPNLDLISSTIPYSDLLIVTNG
jgi:hypothetical protein